MNGQNMKNLSTDWDKVDRLTDDDIDTSDIPELDDAFFKRAKLRILKKPVSVNLQLDPEILAWFKAQKNCEQLINAALRIYMETHDAYGKQA